ncbi:MAG: hypothetical protein ACJA0N_001504 [Pseudohongiellaceae bacterium]|jgi:hypothetical protein
MARSVSFSGGARVSRTNQWQLPVIRLPTGQKIGCRYFCCMAKRFSAGRQRGAGLSHIYLLRDIGDKVNCEVRERVLGWAGVLDSGQRTAG